jgi:hypothetical protein
MPTTISSQPVPLEKGSDGVIRVKGSRVTLDTVVCAFGDGATAEEIAQQYSTLSLPAVYGSLATTCTTWTKWRPICGNGTNSGPPCAGKTNGGSVLAVSVKDS